MKRIIALALVLLMCFSIVACGKNKRNENSLSPEEITNIKSQVVGDWYDVGIDKNKISFNANGTGNMENNGSTTNFTWSYDNSKGGLYIRISGKNFYFDFVNQSDISYVNMSGAWFFKEADMAKGKEMVIAERRSGISKDIEGNQVLTAGLDVKLNDTFGIKIQNISYTSGKLTVEMTLKNNSSSTASLENISELIYINKTKFYMGDCFEKVQLDTLGAYPSISKTELSAGETLSIDWDLFTMEGFNSIFEYWGEVNAYRSVMLGDSEYYIDLGEYIK